MSKIDQAIANSKKMTDLLEEYQQSKIYETCKYHLILSETELQIHQPRYMLFRIKDHECVSYGTRGRIESYIRLRNIDTALIYNFELFTPKEPKEEIE